MQYKQQNITHFSLSIKENLDWTNEYSSINIFYDKTTGENFANWKAWKWDIFPINTIAN